MGVALSQRSARINVKFLKEGDRRFLRTCGGGVFMAIENTSSRPPGDFYRKLLDSSSDPIFCFTPDCRYLYANLAFADGIGRNLEEILGRSVWEVFAKDEADKRASLVKWVFDHGEPKAHEMLVRGRNGTRHYLTTVTPIFDAQGEVTYLLANSKDITIRKHAESVLKASEAKYRALVETTSTGYLILDGNGKVLDANAEYVRLSGYSELREILGRSVLEWTAEYEIERNEKAVTQCAREGFIRNLVIDYVDRNGQPTPVEIHATISGEGDSLQIISLCRDITERKQAELDLANSKSRYQGILQNMTDAYWRIDQEGRIVEANQAICQMLGYSMAELLQMSVSDFEVIESSVETHKHIEKIRREGHDVFESQHRCRDGKIIDIEVNASLALDAPTNIDVFFRDITERKQMQHRILRLALHDPLTQLPNRTLFFDRFSQAVALAKRNEKQVGLLFLDFDGFKPVNDRYGHDAGDRVLKAGADRLLAAVRGIDTVARLGGDEFGIILGELEGPQEAALVAAKLLAAIAQPIALPDGTQASVSASVGISVHPVDGSEMDTLLDKADGAMYQSKHSGGNRFTFWGSSTSGNADDGPWLQMGSEHLVGFDEIDSQHSHLIDLGNRLHKSIAANAPRDAIRRLLAEMIDYVKFHFLTESKLMRRYGYPGKPLHDKAHASLLEDASQFDALLNQGGDRLVLHLIKDWLVTHIETEDMALGEFLKQTECGETRGRV
jgi:diguanylate cyclase (GGDEF)-like protein/hemerythrin-like metal-binding protein/PAS domain S-box-containing protein